MSVLEIRHFRKAFGQTEVLKDINYRDDQDMNRAAAPLRKADDAVEVDTSDIGFDETFELLCELVINTLAVSREQ